ncbi:MAG TPA: Uma2 family endonuclease [Kofleriaceae bacterium]|nr:Uma2 family endonuclease [Kofleriaceae bacterium]
MTFHRAFEPTETWDSGLYLDQAGFWAFCEERAAEGDLNQYELLNGRVVMNPPAGWPHGRTNYVAFFITARVRSLGLAGEVLTGEQGFDLPSGDTVAPDVSFTSKARWAAAPPPVERQALKVVPDLVVEVLSRSTAARDRGEKKAIYESNDVEEYWLIDLVARTLTVFAFDSTRPTRPGEPRRYLSPRLYRDGETAETLLGSFPLADLLPASE